MSFSGASAGAPVEAAGKTAERPFRPPSRGAAVHANITCDGCDQGPIIGERFKCRDMHDFDLCGTCYAKWQSLPASFPDIRTDARFDEIDFGPATLTPDELGTPLPEPHPSWMERLEEDWTSRYGVSQ